MGWKVIAHLLHEKVHAVQKNGLFAFSSPTVVNGPCPAQINVSDGSEKICSLIFCFATSHEINPVPIDPAKIASPTIATCGPSSGQLPTM